MKRYLLFAIVAIVATVIMIVAYWPRPIEAAAGQADAEAARAYCEIARDDADDFAQGAIAELPIATAKKTDALAARTNCIDESYLETGDAYVEAGDTKTAEANAAMNLGNHWFNAGNGLFGVAESAMTAQDWDRAIYFYGLSMDKYDTSGEHYLTAWYAISYASGDYYYAKQDFLAGADGGDGMPWE